MERHGGEWARRGRKGLDGLLGDALIGAMILVGLIFCVGAARAAAADPGGPTAPIAKVRVAV